MDKPVMYMAHDALSNTEMQVSEFDPALLAAAEAQGVIFVAVDAAGDRQIVRACDVTPPSGVEGSFTLVEPVYVDDRMEAVLDVFDAMAALILPESATLAASEGATAPPCDPIEVFGEKLTALREITKAGESR